MHWVYVKSKQILESVHNFGWWKNPHQFRCIPSASPHCNAFLLYSYSHNRYATIYPPFTIQKLRLHPYHSHFPAFWFVRRWQMKITSPSRQCVWYSEQTRVNQRATVALSRTSGCSVQAVLLCQSNVKCTIGWLYWIWNSYFLSLIELFGFCVCYDPKLDIPFFDSKLQLCLEA